MRSPDELWRDWLMNSDDDLWTTSERRLWRICGIDLRDALDRHASEFDRGWNEAIDYINQHMSVRASEPRSVSGFCGCAHFRIAHGAVGCSDCECAVPFGSAS